MCSLLTSQNDILVDHSFSRRHLALWRFSGCYPKWPILSPETILERKFLSFLDSLPRSLQCWILTSSWLSLRLFRTMWVQTSQKKKWSGKTRLLYSWNVLNSIFLERLDILAEFWETHAPCRCSLAESQICTGRHEGCYWCLQDRC